MIMSSFSYILAYTSGYRSQMEYHPIRIPRSGTHTYIGNAVYTDYLPSHSILITHCKHEVKFLNSFQRSKKPKVHIQGKKSTMLFKRYLGYLWNAVMGKLKYSSKSKILNCDMRCIAHLEN